MNRLPKFPVMLRKMWSGSEVQEWIDDNITPREEAWRDLAQRAWQVLDIECPNDPITEELLAALKED